MVPSYNVAMEVKEQLVPKAVQMISQKETTEQKSQKREYIIHEGIYIKF